jgi:pSer/pThr/pTyr-binding forkhead associated (FHA) protein
MAATGPYLEVKDAKGVRKVALTGSPVSIGRNITNMLVIEEPLSSRFHCVIEKAKDGYRVRDLDSRNGILVNGQAAKTAQLEHGDVVAIGATEITLMLTAAKVRAAKSSPLDAPELELLAADDLATSLEPMPLGDLADDEPIASAGPPANPNSPDWERILRDRADSLTNRPFRENDISLINARGQVTHAPIPSAGTRPPPGSEPVTFLRLILLICFRSRATDIHVELKQDDVQVRIRVDGVMVEILRLYKEQRDLAVRLLSLVKILGEIDIAQKNIVQRPRAGRPHGAAAAPRRLSRQLRPRGLRAKTRRAYSRLGQFAAAPQRSSASRQHR